MLLCQATIYFNKTNCSHTLHCTMQITAKKITFLKCFAQIISIRNTYISLLVSDPPLINIHLKHVC